MNINYYRPKIMSVTFMYTFHSELDKIGNENCSHEIARPKFNYLLPDFVAKKYY